MDIRNGSICYPRSAWINFRRGEIWRTDSKESTRALDDVLEMLKKNNIVAIEKGDFYRTFLVR